MRRRSLQTATPYGTLPKRRKNLVVFREQLLAALVGGGRNSGFVITPFDDGYFTMWAWQVCALLSPGFRAKKEQDTFSDFLLGCAADGR